LILILTKVFTVLILFGRLCYALAFGVYLSSFLKDLVCSPRPYAPPVVRLSKFVEWLFSVLRLTPCSLAVGNHHLEYGLPSTHSTNCTFMVLFLVAHAYDLDCLCSLSTTAFALGSWSRLLTYF